MMAPHFAFERSAVIWTIYIKILTKSRFRATASRVRSRSLRNLQLLSVAAIKISRESGCTCRRVNQTRIFCRASKTTGSYRDRLSSLFPISRKPGFANAISFRVCCDLPERKRKYERMGRTSSTDVIDVVAMIAEGNSYSRDIRETYWVSRRLVCVSRLYHGCDKLR